MTEFSLFYTTDGVGDGASSISEAQLADFFNRMFVRDKTRMGYIKGYLNKLEPTLNGRVVSVATGGGMCDGHGYGSDGVETHTLPIPTVGTTGWQLVLRHDPSLRKTRQTLKVATDGVATPPTKTQVEGGTWEMRVTASGRDFNPGDGLSLAVEFTINSIGLAHNIQRVNGVYTLVTGRRVFDENGFSIGGSHAMASNILTGTGLPIEGETYGLPTDRLTGGESADSLTAVAN